MTAPNQATEMPEFGEYQTAFWNEETQSWQVRDLTPEEIAEKFPPPPMQTTTQHVRRVRNNLLETSDWTQVTDAPVNQAAWASYRQELRDVPQQAGFPHNVTWPSKPE